MTQQERIAAAREWHTRHVAERAELEARVSEATERMRTIANLFSASVWAILPARIKTYFSEYRG